MRERGDGGQGRAALIPWAAERFAIRADLAARTRRVSPSTLATHNSPSAHNSTPFNARSIPIAWHSRAGPEHRSLSRNCAALPALARDLSLRIARIRSAPAIGSSARISTASGTPSAAHTMFMQS